MRRRKTRQCRSVQSIIGATQKRCDKLFIRSRFSTLGRSNKTLDRLSILPPREHDRTCSITAWYSQIGTRIRPCELSVHTERTRIGLPVRRTYFYVRNSPAAGFDRGCVKTYVHFVFGGPLTLPHTKIIEYSA